MREFADSNLPSLELQLFSDEPVYDDYEILTLGDSLGNLTEQFGGDDPLVQKVLARFPGAKVVEVRRLAPEPPESDVSAEVTEEFDLNASAISLDRWALDSPLLPPSSKGRLKKPRNPKSRPLRSQLPDRRWKPFAEAILTSRIC